MAFLPHPILTCRGAATVRYRSGAIGAGTVAVGSVTATVGTDASVVGACTMSETPPAKMKGKIKGPVPTVKMQGQLSGPVLERVDGLVLDDTLDGDMYVVIF